MLSLFHKVIVMGDCLTNRQTRVGCTALCVAKKVGGERERCERRCGQAGLKARAKAGVGVGWQILFPSPRARTVRPRLSWLP